MTSAINDRRAAPSAMRSVESPGAGENAAAAQVGVSNIRRLTLIPIRLANKSENARLIGSAPGVTLLIGFTEGMMNTIPKLFVDHSWAAIMNLSAGEQIELAMFGVVSILWIAAMCYGIYRMFRRKPPS
jgi:hypothetical protein